MMLRSFTLAWLVAAAPAAFAAGAQRAQADLACESTGAGPRLECTVRLTRSDGAPLDGARVQLGATMPSMPMAHSVRQVSAAAAGQPGTYRGTLELEMPGVWAVEIDISGPLRDRIVRTLRVECQGEKRCAAPAAAAVQDAAAHHSGHRH